MTDPSQSHLPIVRRSQRPHFGWLAAVLITTLPLTFSLSREMWEAPFPISETVGILSDVGVMGDSEASSHSILDPKLLSFFDPTTRSWYRPIYWVTWYSFWHSTHSLDATLMLFRLLEVAITLLLILGFIWIVKPRTVVDYAAATVGVAVFAGMPGFRENLEIPLLYTLIGMLFALIVWMLLEREHRAWHGPALVLLTVLAVGYKEQGLVLVPLIIGAWWVGAPGVRRSTAVVITVLTLAYLVMRFTTTGTWHPFQQDVGLGFELISANAASERFGAFPYWMYLYNSGATLANILVSEPTGGVFEVTRRALEGRLRPWQVHHVVSSTLTTALLIWWAVRTWRREWSGQWSVEFRLVVALAIAIAASAALGFNYSRDRLGGMAVVFYALASYYAMREAGFQLGRVGRARAVAAGLVLMLMSAGWQLRAIGTVDSVHARARRTHREWISNRTLSRARRADIEAYLRIFNAMEPQGVAPIRPRTTEFERAADGWLGLR